MNTDMSPVQDRQIAKSVGKLQKAASEGRFRIKSFRVKTSENEKVNIDKNYETDLIELGYTRQFLKSLYVLKSEQNQLKITEAKYLAFVRSLHQKIIASNTLELASFNFQKSTGRLFLKQFTKANRDAICLDLSNCTYFSNHTPNSATQSILLKSIFKNKRIVEVKLKNMSLKNQEIQQILNKVIETEKIFDIDIGNDSSQSMNRISDNLEILYQFFKKNTVTAVVRLENLCIKKVGVEHIQKGLLANVKNPLKILCLKNNAITEQASLHISMLAKTGIINLDISENPLGPNFYLNLPSWRSSTVNTLDVSSTNMNSEALIYFLGRLEENKAIQNLKMDRNNFSNNWFNQIKQAFEVNTSIEALSMIDCSIKRMSEAFAGLYHNRYLRKLNISGSQFQQGVKQLCELLKLNKTLTDLKLRFCGLKSESIIKIFQSLSENMSLNCLDISQNQMGDEGAKEAIKTLNINKTLSYLMIEKAQVQVRLKKQIEEKIKANKLGKKNRQFNKLKKQNKNIKEGDNYTWDDVTALQSKIRTNNNNIRILEQSLGTIEKKFDAKKFRFTEIIQQYSDRHINLKIQIDKLEKEMIRIEDQEAQVIEEFRIKQRNAKQAAKQQEMNINQLQQKIKNESLRNRKRENELEDQHQNNKYLKKKQGTKKVFSSKTGFDISTAVNSKRKSRNY